VEYLVRESEQAAADAHSDGGSAAPLGEAGAPSPAASPGPAPVAFAMPPTMDDNHDADEGAQLRYCMIEDLLGSGGVPVITGQDIDQLHAISAEEPTTFPEVEQDECWRQAMREEMKSILNNKTWSIEDLPQGHMAIGLKWVYKLKRNEEGAVVKHKACLVAKGYVQRQGVDFEEVFAPVARLKSVRMLLAIIGHFSWEVHHMNAKSAFLNGVIKETVYVQQPSRFVDPNNTGKALRLHKALYGLRQVPRAWNTKLDQSLIKFGFSRCVTEHDMYIRGDAGGRLILRVYVGEFKVEM
jgi:hypothetical protein